MAAVESRPDWELDHIFVCTPHRMQALEALTAAALNPGPNRVHKGQGTANDCFYFENAYLELLWLNDETEIRSLTVEPLGLWERIQWRETGACPYGIAVRPAIGFDVAALESWPYRASYLPAGTSMPILTARASTKQPLVFVPPGSRPPCDYPPERRAPLVHRGRPRRISSVTVEVPENEARRRGAALESLWGIARIASTGRYHMSVELDGGRGEISDLRPLLPLEIRW